MIPLSTVKVAVYDLIEQHREPDGTPLTLARMAAQIDHLRHALEATAANVRRHEEQLRALNRTRHAS